MPVKPEPMWDMRNVRVPVLRVVNLSVAIVSPDRQPVQVLEGLEFELRAGELTALLGESGAGKSTLALALLRMLPDCLQITAESIELSGQQILSLRERELRSIRGARLAIVHQDTACLNPVLRCGTQIVEVLRAHGFGSRNACREEACRLLQAVGLDGSRFFRAYPHQLSGGQKQRVVIAQAVACRPAVVIADEPTASLDPCSAAEVLALFRKLTVKFGTSFLVITHQPEIISLTDRALVMHLGRIVETGAIPALLQAPAHPYTRQLLACRSPLRARASGSTYAGGFAKSRWPCIDKGALGQGLSADEERMAASNSQRRGLTFDSYEDEEVPSTRDGVQA